MWSVTPRSSNSPRYPSIQLRNLFKTRYRWSGQLVAAKDDGFLRAGIKAAPHAWQPAAAQPDPRLYGGEWPAARCRERWPRQERQNRAPARRTPYGRARRLAPMAAIRGQGAAAGGNG